MTGPWYAHFECESVILATTENLGFPEGQIVPFYWTNIQNSSFFILSGVNNNTWSYISQLHPRIVLTKAFVFFNKEVFLSLLVYSVEFSDK